MRLRQDVRDWVQKAEIDSESARILSRKRKSKLVDAVCFHSQQCAEKYLKALLVLHRISFPKTHDLVELLQLVLPVDPTLELLRPDIMQLNPFAVDFRYPGEFATPTDARSALKSMDQIRNRIRHLLNLPN